MIAERAYTRVVPRREPIWQTRPGDFVLCWRDRDLAADGLRLWEALRTGHARQRWNHVGLFIGNRGEMVEATARGVMLGNVKAYEGTERAVVSVLDEPHARNAAARWARDETRLWRVDDLLRMAFREPGPRLVAGALRIAGFDVDGSLHALREVAGV